MKQNIYGFIGNKGNKSQEEADYISDHGELGGPGKTLFKLTKSPEGKQIETETLSYSHQEDGRIKLVIQPNFDFRLAIGYFYSKEYLGSTLPYRVFISIVIL